MFFILPAKLLYFFVSNKFCMEKNEQMQGYVIFCVVQWKTRRLFIFLLKAFGHLKK